MCVCVCVCVCVFCPEFIVVIESLFHQTCERFSDELTLHFGRKNHSPQLLSFSP